MGTVYRFSDTELRILEMQPTPLAVYQFVDRHVYTLAVSEGFCKLFGYEDKAEAYRVSNQNALANTYPDDVGRLADAVHRFTVEGGKYEVIFRAKLHHGEQQPCRIIHGIGEHVYTGNGVRLAYVWYTDEGEYTEDDKQVATLNKVFNHALHEESFLKANYYDQLTGLPNMTHFFLLAEEEKNALKENGGKAVLLFFDLDGMKGYNDVYGFAEGDKLLKAFARLLEETFGNENCCHVNADHFAVYTDKIGVKDILRRLFTQMGGLNGGNSLPVRVGIYPDGTEEIPMSAACDRAKMACDSIPKSGTSRFKIFKKKMRSELKMRQYLLSNLDRAIAEKWVQVYYQPIVRAVSGRVCDEEALARWIDPVKGFLSPADFIPELENAGVIYKLDLFVVEEVLEKIRTLENAGLYIVPQSVNLSRSDFDACDMVEEIRKRVDAAGISRDRLAIEITESIIGSDFEFMKTQVERFRSLGFPVWMDDFGSGYSALDVLQSIPFDLIKFDMSFMRKLEEGDKGRIILTELMKMATALGVDTICEGVEKVEQVRFLQTIGCSKLQGYYYLKPTPLSNILERYKTGIQIGFENPEETGYYDAMGRINLYDLSFMASVDENVFRNIFDTIPMGIIELNADGDGIRLVRGNQSCHGFLRRTVGIVTGENNTPRTVPTVRFGSGFLKALTDCRLANDRAFIDERTEDGSVIHSFARRVFTNPVTGSSAFAVAILSVDGPRKDAVVKEANAELAANVSQKKEASTQQRIIELQESVSSLLNNMPAMSFTKDAQTGVYLACNQAFAEYAHKETPAGVVGLTDLDIFDHETAAHFVEDDKKALGMDEPYVFFEDVRDAAGGEKHFQTTKLKFIDSSGRQCLLGLCQDVTEAFRIRQERDRTKKAYEEAKNDSAIYARLHELTGNFICVYVIDPESGHYREFSSTEEYEKCFAQAKEGEDFFAAVRKASKAYTYPDDLERLLSRVTMESILAEIEKNGSFTFIYRVLLNGKPLYVQMNAVLVEEEEGLRLVVGLNDIDAEYRQREMDREIARQKDVYDQITASLAEQYDTLYYIDIETDTYVEISSTNEYKKLNVPATGNDFFAESRRSIRKYVHPEDQEIVMSLHYKDVMLDNLKNGHSFSMNWRLVVNGEVRHIRHTELLARDGKHIIVCIKNIELEIQTELALKESQKRSVTFTQIAERLADHYDMIYYIDSETTHYVELSAKRLSGEMKVQEEGDDFFGTARKNADRLIFPEDLERIKLFLDRDNLISQLDARRQLTEDYRMLLADGQTQFTRMSVTYSSDHSHFIICVENREENVRREQEHLSELKLANEMARRDELTHTKNKTAYREMERRLQEEIDGDGQPFGIVVCDINGLKVINDTKGHKAGDEYIKAACMLICRIFQHSPVFRIGGDEFVVVLMDGDYEDRKYLVGSLQRQVEENTRIGEGPIVASGISKFRRGEDRHVVDVFNRADSRMYEDKIRLKEMKLVQESHSLKEKANLRIITEERRIMLEALYKAFEMVSDGTYVFLCDMKYDFSRWSKNAVDIYGLPAEYMYGAGDVWENHIHPEDRAAYHKGIDEIFAGNAAGHDMQYRAQRPTGEYDVLTCRGIVIRDPSGEPDYFVGNIRNHNLLGHIDPLTGLHNQYGFFEDVDSYIKRNTSFSVVLFGISRFSEINEKYGYHFGNRVLQVHAREALARTGEMGHLYRMDGTKFAVISNTLPVAELQKGYDDYRAFLQEGLQVDDRKLVLELHAGALRVEDPGIDSQTVYACLGYADEESKAKCHGELVEFHEGIEEES